MVLYTQCSRTGKANVFGEVRRQWLLQGGWGPEIGWEVSRRILWGWWGYFIS